MDPASLQFWRLAERLVAESQIVIDRPRGLAHPRYPELIYPLDYGYLDGSTAGDGQGIDLWLGSRDDRALNGLLCTVDLLKRDMEIKLLLGCTEADLEVIEAFHHQGGGLQRVIMVRRPGEP